MLMPKQMVKERLDNVKVMADTRDAFDEEMRETFAERVINPVYERMIHTVGNLAPSSIRIQYDQLLSSSGTKDTMKFNNIIAIQLMLGLLLAFTTYYLMQLMEQPVNRLYIVLAGAVGFLLPYSSLKNEIQETD